MVSCRALTFRVSGDILSAPQLGDHNQTSTRTVVLDLKKICVFCGSSAGADPIFRSAATAFGSLLASEQIDLVYGAGSVGIMGTVADAVLKSGGRVTGVIPRFLATRELLHEGITSVIQTEDMHERKATMARLSDAFVALPGGLGTLEELFEVMTWGQLGLHTKPIGLLNVAGYFDPLVALIERAIHDGFCRTEHRELFVVDDQPERLLTRMRRHQPPDVKKWIASLNQT